MPAASTRIRRIALRTALLVVVATLGLVVTGALPTLLGYDSFVVTGSSMEPTVRKGSVVIARRVVPHTIAAGDIITFRRTQDPGVAVTHRVIDAALRQLYAWQRDGLDMKVAVNVSVESLRDPDVPSQLSTALDAWGVRAEKLQLEITESALMVEPEAAVRVLTRLEQMGVGLIVDDFGTGYSAMTYLKLLPVDEIKIDQAFVRGVAADEKDSLIVEAIIGMSKGMGRRVVAEGVETQETWTALAAPHCDMAQGYYMCRPLDASEFTNWLSGPGASLHMLN